MEVMWQESTIADRSLSHHTHCIYDSYLGLSSRLITRLSLSSLWPGATCWYFCSTKVSQHQVVLMTHSPGMLSGKRHELRNITISDSSCGFWQRETLVHCASWDRGDILLIVKKARAAFESPTRRSVDWKHSCSSKKKLKSCSSVFYYYYYNWIAF